MPLRRRDPDRAQGTAAKIGTRRAAAPPLLLLSSRLARPRSPSNRLPPPYAPCQRPVALTKNPIEVEGVLEQIKQIFQSFMSWVLFMFTAQALPLPDFPHLPRRTTWNLGDGS
jgi:hypothetical protein